MPQFRVGRSPISPPATRMQAPPHPFPELQGPFEESMTELERSEEREVPSDAASRRTILLDAPTYERVIAGRWRQRPGEKYHPLWKIVAQISFGIHLLAENLAKSEEEVMQILQGHIDEIDLFLERTTEDFALAQEDIQERMRCLQLPLQHPKVFDRMLEDRTFRTSIVEGNEKIEHIVARTSCAMKDSLKDAQKGLDATSSLEQYLASLEGTWGRRSAEHEAVFEAMLENVEGWRGAFVDLHTQGGKLGQLLQELTEVINQMQQRAGEVSRRLIRAQQKQGPNPTNPNNITYVARQSASSITTSRTGTPDRPARKPLPGVPDRDSVRQSAAQSQRSGTALSDRSATSQRSSGAHKSRTSSREGNRISTRDSAQARLNTKSPRLIEIKRHSPQPLDTSRLTPVDQHRSSRSSGRVVSGPSELPTEMPGVPRRPLPSSPSTASNAGLGISQDDVHSSGKPQPPLFSHESVVISSARSSGLPLTPNSMTSNSASARATAFELPSESAIRHTSAPSLVSTKLGGEPTPGSPPSTPGWAKQTFDTGERNRMVIDKAAFRSHPPTAELGSPPLMFQSRFQPQPQHGRVNGSTVSSLGGPGPEVTSSEHGGSRQSGSVNGNSTQQLSYSNTTSFPSTTNSTSLEPENGTKTFIAELEGTTPALSSAGFSTESSYAQAREVANGVVELEAPEVIDRFPRTRQERSWLHLSLTSTSGITEIQSNGQDIASRSNSSKSPSKEHPTEDQMAAAIRRSFIATSIELPDTSVGANADRASRAAPEKRASISIAPSPPRKPSSKGIDDILAQLEQLNTTSPNLSLKAEEMFMTLPATTYVARKQQNTHTPDTTAPLNTEDKSTATNTINTLNNVNNNHSNVASPGALSTSSSKSQPKPDQSARNSGDSMASSQSQWRAFFKGQLSPAEFNAGTPHIPSKVNSTHKAIVELKRRGQEASPTLGWQWAPESPEMERRAVQRTNT